MKTFLLVIGLVLALGVAPALAGKGGNGNGNGNGGGSSIWIEDAYLARSADGAMHHGDPIAFGFTTKYWDADGGTGPWLRLQCYYGSTLVYWENRAGFEGGYKYGEPFQLGPSAAWSSGDADCVGIVGHENRKSGKFRAEAKVEFHVMP
jgi:hypothetical protein